MKLFLTFMLGLLCIGPSFFFVGYRSGASNNFIHADHAVNKKNHDSLPVDDTELKPWEFWR